MFSDFFHQSILHIVKRDFHVEILRRKTSCNQIGICGGGFCSVLSISNRSRKRTCTLWSNFQRSSFIDPCDGSSTISDLYNIDNRCHDRIACMSFVFFDIVRSSYFYCSLIDQRTFRCCSTHIKCDNIRFANDFSKNRSTKHTGYRT